MNRNTKIIRIGAISTLRKLAGREVMETVQDLTGQKPRSSHCCTTPPSSVTSLLGPKCCAGAEVGGPLERTRRSLWEELTSWKGKGPKWHIWPCEIPGDLSLAHPVSSLPPFLAQSHALPQLQLLHGQIHQSACGSPKLHA